MPVPELAAMLPALNIALPRGSSLEGGVATVTLRSSGRLDQLSSEGSLSVTNATLANFDLGTKMRVIEALTGTRASRNTQIQRMAVNLARTPSGMTIRDIQLVVPTIGQLTGAGTVGSNQELNFQMRVTARAEGGLLAQAARDGVVTAPFFIQGTTADPVIRADTKGLAAEAAKTIAARELEQLRESGRLKGVEESEVGRKALGILDRVLGGNKGEEQK
jgi:AsmA protein